MERTFHQGRHELHGVTVVVETEGPEVYVGRCDDMDDKTLILLDADMHREGEDGQSNEEYLRKAAGVGVFKQFDRLVVPRRVVRRVRRLGEL